MGSLSKTVQINVRSQRHMTAVNLEDGLASFNIRNRKGDFTVKAAWPSQGRVYHFWNIGSPNDNHLSTRNHAIHQGEELSDHPFFDISQDLSTLRGDRIYFIDKNDTGGIAGRLFKDFPQTGLAFTVKFMDDLWSIHSDKMEFGLACNGAGDQGFTCSRWTIEEHSFRCLNAQSFEGLCITQGELYHLPNEL